jgi:hypothetical protein
MPLIVKETGDGVYNFESAQLYFGTDYLLMCAADKYVEQMEDAVFTVMSSQLPGVTPGEKGNFLEAVARRSLCLSADMQLRRLDHSSVYLFEGTSPANVHLFDQVPLEWTWFTTVEGAVQLIEDALKNKKTLYPRPISDTFASVDAIMVPAQKMLFAIFNYEHNNLKN